MKLVHIKCNKFDAKQYERYLEDENPTFCLSCNRENLPFLDLNDKQYGLTMNGVNYPEETDVNDLFLSESQLRMINKINNLMLHRHSGQIMWNWTFHSN